MPTRQAVAALRERFRGQVVLPGDPGYDRARAVWNATADGRPAAVARGAGVEDVVAAVRFAREQELLVAVRGGGHSYPGFSTCDGGVVIDLSPMGGVRVDPERRVATAAGAPCWRARPAGADVRAGLPDRARLPHRRRRADPRRRGGAADPPPRADPRQPARRRAGDRRRGAAPGGRRHRARAVLGAAWGRANFGVATSFELALHPVGPLVLAGIAVYALDTFAPGRTWTSRPRATTTTAGAGATTGRACCWRPWPPTPWTGSGRCWPPPRPDCGVGLLSLGGAFGRVPEDATAFSGRSAALRPFATSVNYVNDLGQLDQDAVRFAHGPAKYDRLVALKRTWDPANVFRRNQNIRP